MNPDSTFDLFGTSSSTMLTVLVFLASATLAFAVMIDGPANWAAYPMLSQVVGAVAKY